MNGRACEHPHCPEHCGDQSGWAPPPEDWSAAIPISETAEKWGVAQHSEQLVVNNSLRFAEISANTVRAAKRETQEIEKYSESLSSPRRCVQTARIFRSGFDHLNFQERASCRKGNWYENRGLLLSVVLLAGLAYVGRQYGPEISLLFDTSAGAVSRAERPNAGCGEEPGGIQRLRHGGRCGSFIEGDLEVPRHLARRLHGLYFNPQHADFEPRTIWACRMRSQRVGATRRNVR